MKRIWPVILLLAAVVLAACDGGQSPVKAPPTSTAAPSSTPVVAQATPAPPTPTPLPNGCQVTSLLPEWDPVFPVVRDTDWQKGPKDATITILEYSDYQCPYCAQVAPVLDALLVKFPKDVRLVYRHFPLNIHDKSIATAQAAEAAGLQGKFWEMHTLLLSKQAEWSSKNPQEFSTWLNTQAKTISGLDAAKFMQDLLSKPISEKVAAALKSAEDIGLNQTPFIILNGRAFGGNPDEATIGAILTMFKQVTASIEPIRARECPAMTIDKSKQYTATVTTSKGDFTIKLYPDKAPLTVNSFVFLAKRGWFDNIPFHRVVDGFVAQSGDPSGTGLGNPGYQYNDEISPDLKYDRAGLVGMANSGANTNGSQFFITFAPIAQLNGSYTIFGEVTSGMEVLKKLTIRDPQIGDTTTPEADKIIKISIDVK